MGIRIVISAPSGYNAREILLPLRKHLVQDSDISEVQVITPAAPFKSKIFAEFEDKFSFHENPADAAGHIDLLRQLSPDVVLTPTVGLDVLDTLILRAAKKLDIPTVTFIASWDNVFKMERLFAKGHSGESAHGGGEYELPDYYAVWNQMKMDHLLRILPTLKPEAITITGAPRFDYFSHSTHIPSRDDLFEYLGISKSSQQLIHCATTELYPFTYIIEDIARARDAKKLAQPVAVHASVHPGGDLTKHQAYKSYGATVRYSFGRREHALHPSFQYLPTDTETYMLVALFRHTGVLVNQSSTVAIESMAAGVPVINVTYGQPWDWWRWYRSMVYRDFRQHYRYITDEGGTTLARNSRQLIQGINAYLNNPSLHQEERQRTLGKMITHTDGSASARLLTLVKHAANSRTPATNPTPQ